MIKEIFKDIPGYEGAYQVSDKGNVKSLNFRKERLLKQSSDSTGYLKISLYKDGKEKSITIHVLVAIAFLNHIQCGNNLVVDHIDNDPLNNNLRNLQIITHRENVSKDRRGVSSQYTGVSWNKSTKKWVASIYTNGKQKNLGSFKTELEAHHAYQKKLKEIRK